MNDNDCSDYNDAASRWAASTRLRAYSRVTVYSLTPSEGTSNMASTIMVSTMLRRPRAPSLNSTALSTM